jgi:threonine/homoserine/homoserine lactone efflux protein
MVDATQLVLFTLACLALAASPGPGVLYVVARTLGGGRAEGYASSLGTALGGLVHVVAGAIGVSALVLASAELFTLLKLAGALYLVWVGWTMIREADAPLALSATAVGARRAFRDGALVEALNPKTAAFFLAFIPQFVDPAQGHVAGQFVVLGLVAVVLNTGADLVYATLAAKARAGVLRRPGLIRRLRQGSGMAMCGLGVALAFARRPAV